MRTFCFKILIVTFIFLTPNLAKADHKPTHNPPGQDKDEAVPIDGGLSLLIAAGVAHSAKKAYSHKKLENKKNQFS